MTKMQALIEKYFAAKEKYDTYNANQKAVEAQVKEMELKGVVRTDEVDKHRERVKQLTAGASAISAGFLYLEMLNYEIDILDFFRKNLSVSGIVFQEPTDNHPGKMIVASPDLKDLIVSDLPPTKAH